MSSNSTIYRALIQISDLYLASIVCLIFPFNHIGDNEECSLVTATAVHTDRRTTHAHALARTYVKNLNI